MELCFSTQWFGVNVSVTCVTGLIGVLYKEKRTPYVEVMFVCL
jgi:hypothetical protein